MGRTPAQNASPPAWAVPALAHRLTLSPELWVQRTDPAEIVGSIVSSVPVPVADDIEP